MQTKRKSINQEKISNIIYKTKSWSLNTSCVYKVLRKTRIIDQSKVNRLLLTENAKSNSAGMNNYHRISPLYIHRSFASCPKLRRIPRQNAVSTMAEPGEDEKIFIYLFIYLVNLSLQRLYNLESKSLILVFSIDFGEEELLDRRGVIQFDAVLYSIH